MGKVTATLHERREVLNSKGKKLPMTLWLMQGLTGAGGGGYGGPWFVGISSNGALVEVRHSGRQLFREGWTLHEPEPEPEAPDETEKTDQDAESEEVIKTDGEASPPPKGDEEEVKEGPKEEPKEEPAPEKGEVGDGP